VIDLKRELGDRYRITLDESAGQETSRKERLWLYQIPCKFGHIYVHGKNRLGGYSSSARVSTKLAAVKGVTVHQRGDTEVTVTFPIKMVDLVATMLGARKRRRMSAEQREARATQLAAVRPVREGRK
jgi:hypothetical protein